MPFETKLDVLKKLFPKEIAEQIYDDTCEMESIEGRQNNPISSDNLATELWLARFRFFLLKSNSKRGDRMIRRGCGYFSTP